MVTIFNSPTAGKIGHSKNFGDLIVSVSSDAPPPANNPPVWDSQPSPSFTNGVKGFYDINPLVSDPDGDNIEFSINNSSPTNLPTGITWGESIIGDGTNYLDGGDVALFDFGAADNATIEIRAKTLTTSSAVLASKGNNGTPAGWELTYQGGSIQGSISDGTTVLGVITEADAMTNDGQWHMISLVIDRTTDNLRIYVDGFEDPNSPTDISTVTGSLANTDAFRCFADAGAGQEFSGMIAEVRIWDDIRTPAEILANHAIEIEADSSFPDLIGYWKMDGTDEGSVTTVQDQTSNNNDLTDTGAGNLTYEDMGVLYYDGTIGSVFSTGHIITISDGTDSTPSGQFGLGFIVSVGDGYPRMAAGRIGQRSWGDNPDLTGPNGDVNTEDRLHMGLSHISVINGQPALTSGRRAAMQDWLNWKNTNYPDHKTYQYINFNETGNSLTGLTHDMLVAEAGPVGQTVAGGSPVSQNCWYARDGDGNLEETYPGTLAVNLTTYVVPNTDLAEDRYYGEMWVDERMPTNFIDPFVSEPFDGYYADVVDHRPREDVLDYAGTNSNNGARAGWNDGGFGEAVADAYRNGHQRGIERIEENYPGEFLKGANGTTWPMESLETDPQLILNSKGNPDIHPEYKDLFHLSWIEGQSKGPGTFGFSGIQSDGTVATFGRPRMACNNYLYAMRWLLPPKHALHQWEMRVTSVNRNPIVNSHVTPAAMYVTRFGMAMTALDDGYFFIGIAVAGDEEARYNFTPRFDEEGVVNTGTTGLTREWLGNPLEAPLRDKEWAARDEQPWISASEIYKREYENGLVLNRWDWPGGSIGDAITGTVNIPVVNGGSLSAGQLPSGVFREIDGVQDPAINQGRLINTTNFPSGYPIRRMDGRFLVRV